MEGTGKGGDETPPLHAPNPYFWIRPCRQRQINTEESFKGINAIIDIMKIAAQSIANIDYYECLMFYSSQSVISQRCVPCCAQNSSEFNAYQSVSFDAKNS